MSRNNDNDLLMATAHFDKGILPMASYILTVIGYPASESNGT
jgi:hypothetical protein